MARGGMHPTDTHVGKRLRMRRLMLGLSQTTIADAPGLSFQQVHKYEKGANRIGASRLRHLSQILKVPEEFFFEEVPPAPCTNRRCISTIRIRLSRHARRARPHESFHANFKRKAPACDRQTRRATRRHRRSVNSEAQNPLKLHQHKTSKWPCAMSVLQRPVPKRPRRCSRCTK
jgi:transcriptional regulator with XRE-family HTH domain